MPTLEQLAREEAYQAEMRAASQENQEKISKIIDDIKELKKQTRKTSKMMFAEFNRQRRNDNVLIAVGTLALGFSVGSLFRMLTKLDMPDYDGHLCATFVTAVFFVVYCMCRKKHALRTRETQMVYSQVSSMQQLTYSIDMALVIKLKHKTLTSNEAKSTYFSLVESYNSIITNYNEFASTKNALPHV